MLNELYLLRSTLELQESSYPREVAAKIREENNYLRSQLLER